jgi:hypothetical protein
VGGVVTGRYTLGVREDNPDDDSLLAQSGSGQVRVCLDMKRACEPAQCRVLCVADERRDGLPQPLSTALALSTPLPDPSLARSVQRFPIHCDLCLAHPSFAAGLCLLLLLECRLLRRARLVSNPFAAGLCLLR